MEIIRKIKSEAKQSLSQSNWARAIATVVVFFSVFAVFDIFLEILIQQTGLVLKPAVLQIAVTLLLFFLFPPVPVLILGINKFFFEVSMASSPSIGVIFHYFNTLKSFCRAYLFLLRILLNILLIWCLCLLPGIASAIFFSYNIISLPKELTINNFGLIASVLVSFLGIVFAFYLSLKYLLAPYFFIFDQDKKISECIKDSKILVKSYKKYFLKLFCSFSPLILSCFFVLPILYLIPYIQTSQAVLAKWIIMSSKKVKEE